MAAMTNESPEAGDPAGSPGEITRLLAEAGGGALDRVFALVYEELRHQAHRRRAFRRPDETLSTTALVHETYLKLMGAENREWRDRGHFFALAARAMRQILIDDARRRTAGKRGAGEVPAVLDEERIGFASRAEDLLALDVALDRLTALDQRLGRLVELRFFAGLSVEETAAALDLSPRTVKRDWRRARAFLYDSLSP
jgi:RNA polymerase sigma-70 factor, ECF subfamily